jgi:hypothetical protein
MSTKTFSLHHQNIKPNSFFSQNKDKKKSFKQKLNFKDIKEPKIYNLKV